MHLKDAIPDIAYAPVPVGLTTVMIMGYPIETWVLVLNVLYVTIALSHLLRKWWKEEHGSPKDS